MSLRSFLFSCKAKETKETVVDQQTDLYKSVRALYSPHPGYFTASERAYNDEVYKVVARNKAIDSILSINYPNPNPLYHRQTNIPDDASIKAGIERYLEQNPNEHNGYSDGLSSDLRYVLRRNEVDQASSPGPNRHRGLNM